MSTEVGRFSPEQERRRAARLASMSTLLVLSLGEEIDSGALGSALGGVWGLAEKLKVGVWMTGHGSHTLWRGTLLSGERSRRVDRA